QVRVPLHAAQPILEDDVPLRELLGGLGDLVETGGDGLDVFALEAGHRGPAQQLGDLVGDLLPLAPRGDKLVETELRAGLENVLEGLDAGPALLGGGLQQVKEQLVLPEN